MHKSLYLFPDTYVIVRFPDKDAVAIVPISRLMASVLLHGRT